MRIALLFSPQGSQAVGMGRVLAEQSAAARRVFEAADAVLGWSVSQLSWVGPEERLNDTRNTQPCLLTTSVACLRALEERAGGSVAARLVAGHSVGEYAAAVAAGALGFDDALRLVERRGALMADAAADGPAGGMAAVIGLDRDRVAGALADAASDELVVANDNAPGQIVISGTLVAIAQVEAALRAAGARRVIRLRVSGAFHSPAMQAAREALRNELAAVVWRDPDPPVVSNVTAEPVASAERLRSLLAEQIAAPVEWVASVRRMAADGIDAYIECGPGAALTGMVRRIIPKARTMNVADPDSLQATLAGIGPAVAA
jgi:[acyl-carrier-protein] S-malonyltransferase